MKITNAWIDDPTLRGQLAPPKLCVEVTEMPSVTIEPESFSGGWKVGKFGPFVNYFQQDSNDVPPSPVSAPDFNARFRNRFPMVIDITLFTPTEEVDGLSLPLPRARQLVRKYANDWRLAVSEKAAESGQLLWEPVQVNPECRHWMPEHRTCGGVPAKFIRVGNVNFPMCQHHIEIHNRAQASRRTQRSA